MGKSVANSVLDAALDKIATATEQSANSQEPTTLTEAVTTYQLATATMAAGDFTIAAGDTSGRKVTMAEKSGITVDNDGTCDHVSLSDGTELLYVTTATAQALTAGNTVTFPSWSAEIADPS